MESRTEKTRTVSLKPKTKNNSFWKEKEKTRQEMVEPSAFCLGNRRSIH